MTGMEATCSVCGQRSGCGHSETERADAARFGLTLEDLARAFDISTHGAARALSKMIEAGLVRPLSGTKEEAIEYLRKRGLH